MAAAVHRPDRRPDVLVVGAGIIGLAIAWHCARRGLRVVVAERAPAAGRGSTARATGGFRAHFETDVNVRLSLLALAQLERFADEHGVDPGFRRVGYLFLAASAAVLAALRDAVAAQRAAGLTTTRLLAPEEIAAVAPHARLDGVLGATWAPGDGYIDPLALHRGFLASACAAGVRIRLGRAVTGMVRDARTGAIASVTTRDAAFTPRVVVLAAGAWSAVLAARAGLAVPLQPVRRFVLPSAPTRPLDPALPLTVWTDDGFHVRVRDDDVLLGLPHRCVPGVDDTGRAGRPTRAWRTAVSALARERVPALGPVAFLDRRAWAGLYAVTPDHHVLLGPHPDSANCFLACGASGHGVMHAAALGLLTAEWIAEGAYRSLDATPLRPSRFREERPIVAPCLL